MENAKAEIRDEQRSLADIKRGQEEQTQLLKEIKRSVDFMVAQEKYTQALIELAALKKNTQEIEAENKRLLEQIETYQSKRVKRSEEDVVPTNTLEAKQKRAEEKDTEMKIKGRKKKSEILASSNLIYKSKLRSRSNNK